VGRLIECSGAPIIVNNCFGLLRKGGRAVLVGLPKEPLHIENVLNDFIFRAITGEYIYVTFSLILSETVI
jgi:threonine dehydrogenase-like Zn-dependent dehydrogenase